MRDFRIKKISIPLFRNKISFFRKIFRAGVFGFLLMVRSSFRRGTPVVVCDLADTPE